MEIYRLETKEGKGVYQFSLLWSRSLEKNAPTVYEDVKLKDTRPKYGRDLYFGFKDLEQYQNWFKHPEFENAEGIKGSGLQLCKFRINKKYVAVGDSQVIFKKEKASRRTVIKEF